MRNAQQYNVYEISIAITVRKRVDQYSSVNLAKLDSSEELPLVDDAHAADAVMDKVESALSRIRGVMDVRRGFDTAIAALEAGGEIVDS